MSAGNKGVHYAEVAKLVYALDLGSSAARRESSSLSFRTKQKNDTFWVLLGPGVCNE